MTRANLFQLGTGLETGAHAEDTHGIRAADTLFDDPTASCNLLDPARDDHFIRRDGVVFAGTHLIIEVENGHGLDEEARIQDAFRDCVTACGATLLHIHTHKFSIGRLGCGGVGRKPYLGAYLARDRLWCL